MDSGTEWAAWFCPWILPGEALRKDQQVLSRTCPACRVKSVPYNCPGLVGSEQAWPFWGLDGDGATFKKSPTRNKRINSFSLVSWVPFTLTPVSKCSTQRKRSEEKSLENRAPSHLDKSSAEVTEGPGQSKVLLGTEKRPGPTAETSQRDIHTLHKGDDGAGWRGASGGLGKGAQAS